MKVFLLYCAISYYVPYVFIAVWKNPLELSFRPAPDYNLGILYVVLCTVLFWLIMKTKRLRLDFARQVLANLGGKLFGPQVSLFMAVAFFVLSFWAGVNLGISFRQSGGPLSEVGALGYLLLILKAYAGVAVLVNYRLLKEGVQAPERTVTLYILAAGHAVNINGSFDVIFTAFGLVAATYTVRRRLGLSGRTVQRVSLGLFPVLICGMFVVGVLNKFGVDGLVRLSSDPDFVARLFVGRLSYDFYSVSTHLSENFFNPDLWWRSLGGVVSNLSYRGELLLGINAERPELGSISRANFLMLSYGYYDRIGATPSLLGSAFFLPGGGLSVFYFLFFARYCIHQAWNIAGRKLDSWLSLLYIVLLVSAVWDAALDALNPFGKEFAYFFFLVLAGSYCARRVEIEGRGRPYDEGIAHRPLGPSEVGLTPA